MSTVLEALMVICFGISWPISIVKSLKSRTTGSKSLVFLLVILTGYLFGIAGKLISGNVTYVLFFYVLNAVMVSTDCLIYLRNRRFDRERGRQRRTVL